MIYAEMDTPVDNKNSAFISLWAACMQHGLTGAARAFMKVGSSDDKRDLRWLNSESNSVGSFNWICDVLELRPEWVREKWRANCRNIARIESFSKKTGVRYAKIDSKGSESALNEPLAA